MGPTPFNVMIPKKSESKALFPESNVPASEVTRFKNILGLSDTQTETACSVIRSWKGREFFEPNLREKLQFEDGILDEFFDVTHIEIDGQKKHLVYCTNVAELISQLVTKREASANHILKIGIDGGGGFLKVCLSILDYEVVESETKFSYKDGLKRDIFKDGGVKKLIILALIEDVKETYSNIKQLVDLLEIGTDKYFFAFDMKLANIYFGIEAASSTHPCSWCELSKEEMQDMNVIGSSR